MPSLPKEITKLGASTPYINACVVADSGWGKTVFAGTHPNVLFISADPEGTESAAIQGSEGQQWVVRTYEDVDKAYRWLRDEGHKVFTWVCIDSITEIQRIFQKSALEKAYEHNRKRDPDILGVDLHQKTQIQVLNFIKQVNDLPMHVLYTATPMRLEDEEGDPYFLPNIHGGKGDLAQQCMGYMMVLGYGTFKDKKVEGQNKTKRVRRIYFQTNGSFRAKDRYDALGNFKDDLTLPRMEQIILDKVSSVKGKKTASKKTATTKGRRRNTTAA